MQEIFRQARNLGGIRRLWLYLYLFKATMSALLVLPFFVTCDSALSRSLLSGSLLNSWDISVLAELYARKGAALPGLIMTIIAGVIVYIIVMQFLNGGLYYMIVSRKFDDTGWKDFFSECGGGFAAHVKITVLMLIAYSLLIPAGMFFVGIVGLAGGHLIGGTAAVFALFKLGIMLLILTAASTFSDSARAAAAAFPGKSFREILKVGADYFRPRLLRLVGVFLVTYIPFLIIWFLAEWLSLQSVAVLTGMIGILLEFVLFQLASAARTGQKLWYLLFLGRDFRSASPGRFLPEQVELSLES